MFCYRKDIQKQIKELKKELRDSKKASEVIKEEAEKGLFSFISF